MTEPHLTYLGLGSNLGDKTANILQAMRHIDELVGPIVGRSALLVSDPWGFVSEHIFVNAVVACRTLFAPHRLLDVTQRVERLMGRREKSVGGVYHDRVIDIDILLYDHLYVCTPSLTLPHPLMQQRRFVMAPLAQAMAEVNAMEASKKNEDALLCGTHPLFLPAKV